MKYKTSFKKIILNFMQPAGYGGLTVVIEGPSKVDVHSEEMEQGTCKISYQPIKAGAYKISIKFSDEDIPGL